jgi:hypothetical protein
LEVGSKEIAQQPSDQRKVLKQSDLDGTVKKIRTISSIHPCIYYWFLMNEGFTLRLRRTALEETAAEWEDEDEGAGVRLLHRLVSIIC